MIDGMERIERGGTVVARSAGRPPFMLVNTLLQFLLSICWLAVAVSGGERIYWILVAMGALGAAFGVLGMLSWRSRTLIVEDDELRFEQKLRSWSVNRADVVAIDGNIPDRPAWSESVKIRTLQRSF